MPGRPRAVLGPPGAAAGQSGDGRLRSQLSTSSLFIGVLSLGSVFDFHITELF